jgi:3-phenylpropionate/cinnamic acid dioxygenase small subunit
MSTVLQETGAAVAPEQGELIDFMTRYGETLDDGRIDDWLAFFHVDGVYQVTTRENEDALYPVGIVYCEGRGMLHDRVKALKIANIFESHVYCHINGQPRVTGGRGGAWQVRSNFVVYRTMYDGAVELFASGKYLDVVARGDDGLRFRERRVVIDSRRIDTLLVFPI